MGIAQGKPRNFVQGRCLMSLMRLRVCSTLCKGLQQRLLLEPASAFFLLLPSTNIIHYYIVGLRLLDPNWLENGKPPVTCKYLPSPAFWTQWPVGFGDQLWAEMPHEECQEQIRESGIWTESLVFTGCLLKQGFIYLFAPKARSLESLRWLAGSPSSWSSILVSGLQGSGQTIVRIRFDPIEEYSIDAVFPI